MQETYSKIKTLMPKNETEGIQSVFLHILNYKLEILGTYQLCWLFLT